MKPWLTEQQMLLSNQIIDNRLPHAMLFSGVVGSGKLELAQWLIQVLLCQQPSKQPEGHILQSCGRCKTCLLFQSQTYPDHIIVSSQTKSIGVDEIRLVSRFLEKTAHIGIYKTVLIPMAEKMTVAASNALLKTLEEPTDNSVIVLLSCEADNLLPTIISRSRLFNLRPPVGNALLDGLVINGEINSQSVIHENFINLTHLPELTDKNTLQQFMDFQEKLFIYLAYQQEQTLILKTLVDESSALRWLETITVNLMRANYNWLAAANLNDELRQRLEQKLKPDTLWSIYQVIVNSNKQMRSYSQANRQFVMEKLLIDIGELAISANK
ncbi:MAG: DNA polymerase III subunit delta' [Colwellia sp.]|nr:DNA polymerase III subunit delta' [Colwellia sp.]